MGYWLKVELTYNISLASIDRVKSVFKCRKSPKSRQKRQIESEYTWADGNVLSV